MQRVTSLLFSLATAFIIAGGISACSDSSISSEPSPPSEGAAQAVTSAPAAEQNSIALQVYKSPTCGCCQEWVDHAAANGIASTIHHPEDLNVVKEKFGIAARYQSCHTGVSSDGYIFEGHVPARLIRQFLAEKPADAIGLAVPGMPIGSPGMEMDDKITPYDVLLLNRDGTSRVYARVNSLEK